MDRNKLIRAGAGVIALLVVFSLVANWVGDYRSATNGSARASASEASTPTAESEGASTSNSKPAATEQERPASSTSSTQVLIVAVDGLNFRKEPSGQSKAMRGLAEGEKVTLLATEGDWFKVRDSKKVVGYITSSPTYTDPAE